jgi:3-oxoadipate enol-lactonase
MDHYGIEKANSLGLSMGGMTGPGVAIEHPSRIARLICVTRARMRRPRSWTIGPLASPLLRVPATWSPLRPLAKAAGSRRPFMASHPYVVDKVMKMILATSTRGYIGCARALQMLDYSAIWSVPTQCSSFAALRTERRRPPSYGR